MLLKYSFFVAKVNEGVYNGFESKEAIREAIAYCIENDILTKTGKKTGQLANR